MVKPILTVTYYSRRHRSVQSTAMDCTDCPGGLYSPPGQSVQSIAVDCTEKDRHYILNAIAGIAPFLGGRCHCNGLAEESHGSFLYPECIDSVAIFA